MPSLNFKKPFVPMILSGRKPHTIRGLRKHPIRIGDPLFLFTGLRTKQVRRLGMAKATATYAIRIDLRLETVAVRAAFTLGGISPAFALGEVSPGQILSFTWADGFETPAEFFAFFRAQSAGNLFEGHIIDWKGTFEPYVEEEAA